MKGLLRVIIIFTAVSCILISSSFAQGPMTKLGRGLTNTCTGWIELPFTLQKRCREHDYMVGIFLGLPEGLFKALLRTGAGVYETVTFFVPFPNDYGESIIEPEFVVESPLEETRL